MGYPHGQAIVPGEQPDWPDALRSANEAVRVAAQDYLDAQTVNRREDALSRLRAARRDFGREMLALDRARRPDFYAAVGRKSLTAGERS